MKKRAVTLSVLYVVAMMIGLTAFRAQSPRAAKVAPVEISIATQDTSLKSAPRVFLAVVGYFQTIN